MYLRNSTPKVVPYFGSLKGLPSSNGIRFINYSVFEEFTTAIDSSWILPILDLTSKEIPMTSKFTWYGHAALGLETGGYKLVIDPFFGGNPADRKSTRLN